MLDKEISLRATGAAGEMITLAKKVILASRVVKKEDR